MGVNNYVRYEESEERPEVRGAPVKERARTKEDGGNGRKIRPVCGRTGQHIKKPIKNGAKCQDDSR